MFRKLAKIAFCKVSYTVSEQGCRMHKLQVAICVGTGGYVRTLGYNNFNNFKMRSSRC
jgi:hypothetical protein